ncbi:hypothetical protein ADUPG1_005856, partial [Aduncisulcus paluster]
RCLKCTKRALKSHGARRRIDSHPYPQPQPVSKVNSLWSSKKKHVREVGKIAP